MPQMEKRRKLANIFSTNTRIEVCRGACSLRTHSFRIASAERVHLGDGGIVKEISIVSNNSSMFNRFNSTNESVYVRRFSNSMRLHLLQPVFPSTSTVS
jgi:hypothetical protein